MQVIGFTNRYYTLWEVTRKEITYNGRSIGSNYIYTYIKNISTDREKAISKYPEATLDLELKGHTSFEKFDTVEYEDDVFSFGKYKGMPIKECTDMNYLCWLYNNIEGDRKDLICAILFSNGYRIYNSKFVNYEEYQKLVEIENKKDDIIAIAMTNGKVVLNIKHNPNDAGNIKVNDVIYKFEKVQENWYNGYDYYLPVLNGKAKRIKNKKIEATLRYDAKTNEIIIANFKIVK